MEPEPFAVAVDEEQGVVRVAGDPSETDLVDLGELLRERGEQQLTVDLGALVYVPSRIIGVVAAARVEARRRGGDLRLTAARGTVAHRVLELSGMLSPS